MDPSWNLLFGFVTLLVFPLLGMLSMLKKRASPTLWTAVLLWIALGAVGQLVSWPPSVDRTRLIHDWLVGCALGAAFLVVDWLRTRRRVARWLRISIGLVTVAVFVKALHDFLTRYA